MGALNTSSGGAVEYKTGIAGSLPFSKKIAKVGGGRRLIRGNVV
jgi:hypothetical protein